MARIVYIRISPQLSLHIIYIIILNNKIISDGARSGMIFLNLHHVRSIWRICRTGLTSETGINTLSDRKQYRHRPEAIPLQTGSNTDRDDFPEPASHAKHLAHLQNRTNVLDRNKYPLRPEAIPPQTGSNTIADRKQYHHRPEAIPLQTGSNTITDRKQYHHRPEAIPSQT